MIEGLTFTISGAPRTKKNHGRRIKRGVRTYNIPSEAFEEWSVTARRSLPSICQQIRHAGVGLPITVDVNCKAVFYRHADVGDAVGYYQAVADWMEDVGILANDIQIRQWDGSVLRQDRENLRIEITLDQLGPREKTPRAARKSAKKERSEG